MANNTTTELAHLYHDARHILRKIERLTYRPDCPDDIRYNVLKPIRSKLVWFKIALGSKLPDAINRKAYEETHSEGVRFNRISRVFSRMNPNQQEFAANMISWIADGKVLKVEIAGEEEEEEIF